MRHRCLDPCSWSAAWREHRYFERGDARFLQRFCIEGATTVYPNRYRAKSAPPAPWQSSRLDDQSGPEIR
jgi:hypothetical protein